MSEPSERDREMANEVCRTWYCGTLPAPALARRFAAARARGDQVGYERGRREAIEECAKQARTKADSLHSGG